MKTGPAERSFTVAQNYDVMVQHVRPPFVQNPRPRRILVIGGGIAGVAALRALVEEDGVGSNSTSSPFSQVELIERRDNIGGVWYLNDDTVRLEKSFTKGSADGRWPVRAETANGTLSNADSKPLWPSPAYPALRGNVLPRFLSLAGSEPFPAPADSKEAREASEVGCKQAFDPFPTLAETHAYIDRVAEPLRKHIRCNTECVGVWELPDRDNSRGRNRWAVRLRDWNAGGTERTEFWDAVVLAIGWTDNPSYPRSTGLEEAREAGFVEHCKWYRGPEPYSRKERIVVIGNGNSGNDVCAQLAAERTPGVDEPILRICRHKAYFFYVSLADPMIRDMPAIERFEVKKVDGRKILNIHLIDGQVLERIDRVISAVGYQIGHFPFVQILDEKELTPQQAQLLSSVQDTNVNWTPGREIGSPWRAISSPSHGTEFDEDGVNPARVSGLYMHILHSRAATLAIVNLTVTSVPFWTSDFQSHCIRATWDGSAPMPPTMEDRLSYERERIAFIRSLHEQKEEALRAASQEQLERQAATDALRSKQGLPALYEPPEAIALMPYHILGTRVADYFAALKLLAVGGKAHWERKLPDFADSESMHDGMYGLKYRTLEAKQAFARCSHSSAERSNNS